MNHSTNLSNTCVVEELDDELEDFEEIGGSEILADPDALQWEEDWDVAGWDDEDGDDEFVTKLNEELQRYKNSLNQDNVTSNATTTEPEKN